MNTDAIQALGTHDEIAPAAIPLLRGTSEPDTTSGPSFLQRVSDGLNEVNQQLLVSQQDLQRLAVGEADSLHAVMVRLEESRISLQLLLQVRNRVLEAYQDVMRMQI